MRPFSISLARRLATPKAQIPLHQSKPQMSPNSSSFNIHTIRSVLHSPFPSKTIPLISFAIFVYFWENRPAVLKVEYAVRGAVPLKAGELQQRLDKGDKLPFSKIVSANIGNPQQTGLNQKPITWWRQVRSLFFSIFLFFSFSFWRRGWRGFFFVFSADVGN